MAFAVSIVPMTNRQYWTFWGLAMLVFAGLVGVLVWQLHELNTSIQTAIALMGSLK